MYLQSMRSAGVWLVLLGALAAVSTQTAFADNEPTAAADNRGVLGYWKSIDKDTGKTQSIFRLWQDKGKLIGKIVKTFPRAGKPPQVLCTECSGSQKNKPVIGLIFFWGFVRDQDNPRKWVDGTILNPEDGRTYHAEASLSADGKKLDVYGYIRVLVKLGGDSVWERPTAEEMQGI